MVGARDILVISGQMRSGTSALARTAHQLGARMAHSFASHPPGTTDRAQEYEDQYLNDYVLLPWIQADALDAVVNPADLPIELQKTPPKVLEQLRTVLKRRQRVAEFVEYLRIREQDCVAQQVYQTALPGWGVKSPYLLLFLEELYEAAEASDFRICLVLTERPTEDSDASLKARADLMRPHVRETVLASLRASQKRLLEARANLSVQPDLIVSYADIQARPHVVAAQLAELLGIEDPDLVHAMTGVGALPAVAGSA